MPQLSKIMLVLMLFGSTLAQALPEPPPRVTTEAGYQFFTFVADGIVAGGNNVTNLASSTTTSVLSADNMPHVFYTKIALLSIIVILGLLAYVRFNRGGEDLEVEGLEA